MPGKPSTRKRRFAPPLPTPERSAHFYVRLAPADVALFRFLLEAEDNLAYMSTVDRWGCVLRITFSPHQQKAVRQYLETMRNCINFTYVLDT